MQLYIHYLLTGQFNTFISRQGKGFPVAFFFILKYISYSRVLTRITTWPSNAIQVHLQPSIIKKIVFTKEACGLDQNFCGLCDVIHKWNALNGWKSRTRASLGKRSGTRLWNWSTKPQNYVWDYSWYFYLMFDVFCYARRDSRIIRWYGVLERCNKFLIFPHLKGFWKYWANLSVKLQKFELCTGRYYNLRVWTYLETNTGFFATVMSISKAIVEKFDANLN